MNEQELKDAYRDAYLRWGDYYSGFSGNSMDMQQRYGTSPVKDCYWAILPDPYEDKPTPTMIFKRYEPLSVPESNLSLLSRVFLGISDTLGYKYANAMKIANDSWEVNLHRGAEMDIEDKMKAFLGGFHKQEENMVGIDVSDELKDLLKVYGDAEAHLKNKEKNVLENLVNYMKAFVETFEERKKVSRKLENLKAKMNSVENNQDEDEDDDE